MAIIHEVDFWDILSCGLVDGLIKTEDWRGMKNLAKGFFIKYRASENNDSVFRIYRDWQLDGTSSFTGFINSRPGKEEFEWVIVEVIKKRKEVLEQCEKCIPPTFGIFYPSV
jgi:hypothetical protein